jgi:branched-chain amino acid transport system substrate-binding protein
MKTRISKMLVLVSLVLLLAGLTVGDAWAKPVVAEWEIPFLLFQTGPFAGFTPLIQFGCEEPLREINAAGGAQGIPIKIRYYDTALDPAKAVAEMSKVVEKSLLIWGPVGANEVRAAAPLAVRHKVMAISPACGYDVSANFKPWQLHFGGPFDEVVSGPLGGWIKKNPEIKGVVQLVWPNDPTWMDYARAQRKALEKLGAKVFPDVEVSEGIDMGSAVIKAMANKPEGYIVTVGPTEAGKIILELQKRGVTNKGRIMVFNTADSPELYKIAGEALDGVYHYNQSNLNSTSPKWLDYSKRFEEKLKARPTWATPIWYDMVVLTGEALDKTGVTGDPAKLAEEREKIRDYMRNYKGFKGITATYNIVDGFAKMPSHLFIYEGGKKVLLESFYPE